MADTATRTHTQHLIERHDQSLIINVGRYPIAMVRGQGSRMWDAEGKGYLDLFTGFGGTILGHCHPDLVDAVTSQAQRLWHVGNLLHTEPQVEAAEAISRHGFGGRSYFCHSGADANEAAFKLARTHGRLNPGPKGARYKVISTLQSFHGRTFAAMVATGQKKVYEGYEPFVPGFSHVPYNDLNAMAAAIDELTAAIIVEPMQGEGGVVIPDDNYLIGLRHLADQHNLLLIFDEVWTGGGRTGKWFGHQHWPVKPDVMTLAKGVGGGLPVGVMCASPKAAELFDHRKFGGVAHATTLGGNCLSLAVCARIFKVIARDGLLEHATQLGSDTVARLQAMAKRVPMIQRVRGKGLFIGIDLDLKASEGRFAAVGDIVKAGLAHGLLINGTQSNIIRLAPALTITAAEMAEGLDLLEAVLTGKA
jgi:predicted acetylornithine/succinylornithine family transaminase